MIEELIKLAKDMRAATQRGEELGLTDDEVAFYDALETNDSAVEAMGDDELKVIAGELVTQVRKSVTIDWTSAKAPAPRSASWSNASCASTATRPTCRTKQPSSSLHKPNSSAQNGPRDNFLSMRRSRNRRSKTNQSS